MWYMVFGSERHYAGFTGETKLAWVPDPIGVYSAENPDEACKAAASDYGKFSTFFAIEGYPWGIETMPAQATRLGDKPGLAQQANDRIAGVLERMDAREQRIEQLQQQLEKGKDDDRR